MAGLQFVTILQVAVARLAHLLEQINVYLQTVKRTVQKKQNNWNIYVVEENISQLPLVNINVIKCTIQ